MTALLYVPVKLLEPIPAISSTVAGATFPVPRERGDVPYRDPQKIADCVIPPGMRGCTRRRRARVPSSVGSPQTPLSDTTTPSPLSASCLNERFALKDWWAAIPVNICCALLQVAEHRVAEDLVAVAYIAARVRPRPPTRGAPRLTSRDGSCTGSGRSSISSNIEKMPTLAPMPSASDTMAIAVADGVRRRVRSASFRLTMRDAYRRGAGRATVGRSDG